MRNKKRKRFKLWFAEKFVSLLIEQHPAPLPKVHHGRCDLLKNSYLCLLNNTNCKSNKRKVTVVICWKIRIFAYWTTPVKNPRTASQQLWFAEKFVSLLIEQHLEFATNASPSSCDLLKNSYLCLLNNTLAPPPRFASLVVICWKIRIFAYWTTPETSIRIIRYELWFAEKFVSLLIEQHLHHEKLIGLRVVICWKIRIFAYWTTPYLKQWGSLEQLWFAEKFVSLLIEQHQPMLIREGRISCDLLKNSYLCLLNNTK